MLNHLLNRSFIHFQPFKFLEKNGSCFILTNKPNISTQASSTSTNEDFWQKNARLKRPLSPFSMYKIQLTSSLSFSHRLTGLFLGVGFYSFGLSQLFASSNFINQMSYIHSIVPASVLLVLKCLVTTSFAYHFFAGIRHLIWDLGYGFTRNQIYNSAYLLLTLTLLSFIVSLLYLR